MSTDKEPSPGGAGDGLDAGGKGAAVARQRPSLSGRALALYPDGVGAGLRMSGSFLLPNLDQGGREKPSSFHAGLPAT